MAHTTGLGEAVAAVRDAVAELTDMLELYRFDRNDGHTALSGDWAC